MPGFKQSRMFIGGSTTAETEKLLQLRRNKIKTVAGLLTGLCLNKHLPTIGVVEGPTCQACCEDDEDSQHILRACPTLKRRAVTFIVFN